MVRRFVLSDLLLLVGSGHLPINSCSANLWMSSGQSHAMRARCDSIEKPLAEAKRGVSELAQDLLVFPMFCCAKKVVTFEQGN